MKLIVDVTSLSILPNPSKNICISGKTHDSANNSNLGCFPSGLLSFTSLTCWNCILQWAIKIFQNIYYETFQLCWIVLLLCSASFWQSTRGYYSAYISFTMVGFYDFYSFFLIKMVVYFQLTTCLPHPTWLICYFLLERGVQSTNKNYLVMQTTFETCFLELPDT